MRDKAEVGPGGLLALSDFRPTAHRGATVCNGWRWLAPRKCPTAGQPSALAAARNGTLLLSGCVGSPCCPSVVRLLAGDLGSRFGLHGLAGEEVVVGLRYQLPVT
ncbi:hypothetical protein SALB_00996 [Streptomyces noursei]|uniref:Uncharacterized protein n=1 Tax=Streptomyces noursei TaxID=1971 RepID=A0A401QSE1_STRNR|nr:hypothetical protein SALB_00996 [Streptomyces noursei]